MVEESKRVERAPSVLVRLRAIGDRMSRAATQVQRGQAFDREAATLDHAVASFLALVRLEVTGSLPSATIREELSGVALQVRDAIPHIGILLSPEVRQAVERAAERMIEGPGRSVAGRSTCRRFDPLRSRALLPGSIVLGTCGDLGALEVAETPAGPRSFVLSLEGRRGPERGEAPIAGVEIVDYDPGRGRLRLLMLDRVPFTNPPELQIRSVDGHVIGVVEDGPRLTVEGVHPGQALEFRYRTGGLTLGVGRVRFRRALPSPATLETVYGFPAEEGRVTLSR